MPARAPQARAPYPGAHFAALRRDRLGYFTGLARQHGDVVRGWLGPYRMHLVSHPDLIRDVLVTHQRRYAKGLGLERAKRLLGAGLLTSEGETHLRQRRLAQPAFHAQRVAGYGSVMAQAADRVAGSWTAGATVDAHGAMMGLTLSITAQTLFGSEIESEAAEIRAAVGTTLELFQSFLMLPLAALIERLPIPPVRRFNAARARLDATIYRMIAERRASGVDRGDLLSMLLLAQDVEGGGGGMSDEQLRDEAMTIFLAGHETTASALTFALHLLARHPDADARLHAEVAALGHRPLGAEDLPALPYTRQVLAEAMRLYPPAWILGRRARETHEIGGYTIPAGSLVFMSQWVVHRDPRWYAEPERFDPERWSEPARAARPRFAYFPFGAGTRVCIGEQFAWMEGVLVLATIAQRWRLEAADGAPLRLAPTITLRPRDPVRLRLVQR
jgi:cytochrome P450